MLAARKTVKGQSIKKREKSGKKMLESMMVNRVSGSRGDEFAEGQNRDRPPTKPSMFAPRPMMMSGHSRKRSYDALKQAHLHHHESSHDSSSCDIDQSEDEMDSELKVDEILD